MSEPENLGKIAIVGCGLIGRSWAVAFARAGHEVALFDRKADAMKQAGEALGELIADLRRLDLLSGQSVEAVQGRISFTASLTRAVADATYVQENTTEDVGVKSLVFEELDRAAPREALIASSTSALLPSAFSSLLPGAHRCLVAHPLNPPHLIPAVEIVPSPQTSAESVNAAAALLVSIGQRPVILSKEIEGFVMNRLQGAILDEAIKLVAEGFAQAGDIDVAVKHGLAMRWSFMGPFETIDLNAPGGVADFLVRYRDAYASIGRARPDRIGWESAAAEAIVEARRNELPLADLQRRQAWRDRRLADLVAHLRRARDEIGD